MNVINISATVSIITSTKNHQFVEAIMPKHLGLGFSNSNRPGFISRKNEKQSVKWGISVLNMEKSLSS